jgi:hypothetical protein
MAKAVSLDAAKPAYEAGALAEDLTSGISKLKETQNLHILQKICRWHFYLIGQNKPDGKTVMCHMNNIDKHL